MTTFPALYVMWIPDGNFWVAEETPFKGATKYIPEPQPETPIQPEKEPTTPCNPNPPTP